MDNQLVCSLSSMKYTLSSECPGLPHAVVKQAENFSVREGREEDRESSSRFATK